MLQASGICISYGERLLLEDVSFALIPGERLGLIGRNGCGKTTLFRMILGEEHPDSGQLSLPKHYRVGHLAQHLRFSKVTVLEEAAHGLEPEDEYKAKIVLSGLGFSDHDFELPPGHFSGGFQIRIELARVLLSEPNLLLLDEPTNYLDIVSLRWLERFLREWKNEMIIISHDRAFMDAVTTHTMIIHRRRTRKIEGGTEKLYQQLEQDDLVYERTRENLDAQRRHIESFVERFRAKASKATLVQSRIKTLERLGKLEELESDATLDFEFRELPFPGKVLLEAKQVQFGYEPDSLDTGALLIKNFSLLVSKNDRIGVIGKNGKGKSTLLRLLAKDLNPLRGEITVSPNTSCGYFGQTNIQRLAPQLTVAEEIATVNPGLSMTAVRNICGTMMFRGDDALKRVKILSGGEKSRVLLGKLLACPSNLLLLDEPTNHLDIPSVDALIESLRSYQGALVIVTHNERILRALVERLIVFQNNGAELFEGNYDYFLEKRGWDEETEEEPTRSRSQLSQRTGPKPNRDAKADRKARAEGRQARAAALKPLEQEVKRIEGAISALERTIQENEAALIEASQLQTWDRIARLSKETAEARSQIDRYFDQLSEAVKSLEEAKRGAA